MNGAFPYNNFIYLITLNCPTTKDFGLRSPVSEEAQSGTEPLPTGLLLYCQAGKSRPKDWAQQHQPY